MANNPSIGEAVERARAAQESRLDSIRLLAKVRQELTDTREQAAQAERDDISAYNAALSAGWSTDELRKIGYTEPAKKVRVRRRAVTSSSDTSDTPDAPVT